MGKRRMERIPGPNNIHLLFLWFVPFYKTLRSLPYAEQKNIAGYTESHSFSPFELKGPLARKPTFICIAPSGVLCHDHTLRNCANKFDIDRILIFAISNWTSQNRPEFSICKNTCPSHMVSIILHVHNFCIASLLTYIFKKCEFHCKKRSMFLYYAMIWKQERA